MSERHDARDVRAERESPNNDEPNVRSLSEPSSSARPPGYYIATNLFGAGGHVYENWGPFLTFDLAIRVRVLLEELPVNKRRNRTFAIDSLGRVKDGQWTNA